MPRWASQLIIAVGFLACEAAGACSGCVILDAEPLQSEQEGHAEAPGDAPDRSSVDLDELRGGE